MRKKRKVQVVIINGEKEVLLLKTNEKRGRFWQNITGSVEEGEDFITGAKREFREETGLDSEKYCLQFIDTDYSFSFTANTGRYQGQDLLVEERVFVALLKEPRPKIILDPMEHEGMEWKKIEDLNEGSYKFSSSFIAFTEAIKSIKL
jgi:8-oxo-dGTP pyrophosphatase MutT (NUDIX family)